MTEKWIICEELCSRWYINKYTLAQIVFDGKLQSFSSDDFSAFYFLDGGSYKESPDGQTMSLLRHEPFTVDEVTNLVFRISDIEKYEVKNGITPLILPTASPQKVITEKSSDKQSHDKFSNKKNMPKPRVAFAYDEAKKLRRDCPELNQVMALKKINVLLKSNGYNDYSRTQFNRIVKNLNFPPARRGRKSTK